jgi:outer membrane protein assembly factor BamB
VLAVQVAFQANAEYLGNIARTGYVDAHLLREPVMVWRYDQKHAPVHAWDEPMREVQYIDFDYVDQPALANGTLYFGSSADHKVYALDLATGQERWTFFTGGPVRCAPVPRGERVFASSDDGFLYCLSAADGKELWRFRGGPTDRKLLGNGQMISLWPARSGVLIDGNKLYFAAGMWSREGTFIYCLNPDDGRVIWKNDTSGYAFPDMPHGQGFGGVSPQGYLMLHKGKLCVPCGRALPAVFNANTGKLLWHENDYEKMHHAGGSWLAGWGDYVICRRRALHRDTAVRAEPIALPGGVGSGLMGLNVETGIAAWAFADKDTAVMKGDTAVLAGYGEVIAVDLPAVLEDYAKRFAGKVAMDKNVNNETSFPVHIAWWKKKNSLVNMTPAPYKKWGTDVGRV